MRTALHIMLLLPLHQLASWPRCRMASMTRLPLQQQQQVAAGCDTPQQQQHLQETAARGGGQQWMRLLISLTA